MDVDVKHTEEPLDFQWRITKTDDDSKLEIEVGDQFSLHEAFDAGVDGAMQQVACDALMMGCKLLGVSYEAAKAVTTLAAGLAEHEQDEILSCGCMPPCEGHEREEEP